MLDRVECSLIFAPLLPLFPEPIMTTPTQVSVNEQLVEFDALLDGLRFLAEETKTDVERSLNSARSDVLSRESVMAVIQEYLSSESFSRRMITYFKRYQVPIMADELKNEARTLINDQLEAYVLSKIDERIEHFLTSRNLIS